jgi:hypothetical protein
VVPSTWQFNAPLPPALRRGLLAALPVGVSLLLDLELDLPAAGAVSTGLPDGIRRALRLPPKAAVESPGTQR